MPLKIGCSVFDDSKLTKCINVIMIVLTSTLIEKIINALHVIRTRHTWH